MTRRGRRSPIGMPGSMLSASLPPAGLYRGSGVPQHAGVGASLWADQKSAVHSHTLPIMSIRP